MIRKIWGKLKSKGGFSLVESFLAFAFIVGISLVVLNTFSQRTILALDTAEVEKDHMESMKAISKSLAFTGTKDRYEIKVSDYVPTLNLEKPTTLSLTGVLDYSIPDVVSKGKRLAVLNRYVLGETLIEIDRKQQLEDYRISITQQTYKAGKFGSMNVASLIAEKESDIKTIGVYFPIPDKLYSSRHEKSRLGNLIIPKNKNSYGVETYEKNF